MARLRMSQQCAVNSARRENGNGVTAALQCWSEATRVQQQSRHVGVHPVRRQAHGSVAGVNCVNMSVRSGAVAVQRSA